MNMITSFLALDHLISGPVLAKGNKCNVVCDFHLSHLGFCKTLLYAYFSDSHFHIWFLNEHTTTFFNVVLSTCPFRA